MYICIYIYMYVCMYVCIYHRSESRVYPYFHIKSTIIYHMYHCTTVFHVRPASESACYRSLPLSSPPPPSLCLALLSARRSDMIYIMPVIINVYGIECRCIHSSRCLEAESGSANPPCMDHTRVCILPVCLYDGMLASYPYCG